MVLERRNDVQSDQADASVRDVVVDVDGEGRGVGLVTSKNAGTSKRPNMSMPAPSEVEIR